MTMKLAYWDIRGVSSAVFFVSELAVVVCSAVTECTSTARVNAASVAVSKTANIHLVTKIIIFYYTTQMCFVIV